MQPLSYDLPPGFATLKTRPMNSMVVNSDPFASSGRLIDPQSTFTDYPTSTGLNYRCPPGDLIMVSLKSETRMDIHGAPKNWSGPLPPARQG